MDDLIPRAAAVRALASSNGDYFDAWERIEKIPAVDAVPVVRCKDCKYSDIFADVSSATMPLKCLNIRYGGVYPDWYCEHGERRDDDGSAD